MRSLLLLLLSFSFLYSPAQEKLSNTEKLAATAKVWGFLKYYHPAVAQGNYDWDAHLFELLEKTDQAETKEELSQLFLDKISSLGDVKECKKCRETDNLNRFEKNFDLSWMDDKTLFTSDLSAALRHIEHNRHQGEGHYVRIENRAVGNLEFSNEKSYEEFDWTNRNLRLLTLFRYWNIVNYFFPYKYMTDTDWNEVLERMLPQFLSLESEEDFHLTMLELVVSIDDSHGVFNTGVTRNYFGNYWIPADFKLIDGKAVITSYYNDSLALANDIRIGDVITKVNGREVEHIFEENLKYIPGSNLSRKRYYAYSKIFNGPSDAVELEFIRDGQTHHKTVSRYVFEDFNYTDEAETEKFKILDGHIGYVNMGELEIRDVSKMMKDLKDTKAIIFDLRNYPNNTGYTIAEYVSSGKKDFARVIIPDLDYPGKFSRVRPMQAGKNTGLKYKGKVVLLVNEASQSHSEFTAMLLQTGDHVTTLGSQTSGADGNVDRIELPGGYKTMITGIGIFYPDGTAAQRKGVKVDIEVKPTLEGLVLGRDEVLERAIEFINNSNSIRN